MFAKQLIAALVAIAATWLFLPAAHGEFKKPRTDHWSFQPVRRPEAPATKHAAEVRNPIDAFILAKLEQKGLEPSPAADRATLIRRLHLTLHGLPPTPEAVAAAVNDARPDWYEQLVEQLLASPRYGERWAQHWLDLVRYADSNGFETNRPRATAWRYRDYVIAALNADEPYDQFILEQLAGDAVGVEEATGFLVAGPHDIVAGQNRELTLMQRSDGLADIINATTTSLLGLTVACARCHDHKFDAISQHDYYAVEAVFAGVQHAETPLEPGCRQRLEGALKAVDGKIDAIDKEFAKGAVLAVSAKERQTMLPGLLADYHARRNRLVKNKEEASQKLSAWPTAYAGAFAEPPATHLLDGGDPMSPAEVVGPGCIDELGALALSADAPEQRRRIALAQWIGHPDNPLTARVMVNRLWQQHFGRGLVSTPSDFGVNGARPSHPDLLDYLAAEYVASGWSIKHVQRHIVLSAAYRQSSAPNAADLAADAQNELVWRFAPRRMEAEAIRDGILLASGKLDLAMSGPGFALFEHQPGNVYNYVPKSSFGPAEWRRMIYAERIRGEQDAAFGAFDCPDGGQVAPRRERSTTPLQALNLLNSTFVNEQAEFLAERARAETDDVAAEQVDCAFQLALQRSPTDEERVWAGELVEQHGLVALTRALLNANEFLFVF